MIISGDILLVTTEGRRHWHLVGGSREAARRPAERRMPGGKGPGQGGTPAEPRSQVAGRTKKRRAVSKGEARQLSAETQTLDRRPVETEEPGGTAGQSRVP